MLPLLLLSACSPQENPKGSNSSSDSTAEASTGVVTTPTPADTITVPVTGSSDTYVSTPQEVGSLTISGLPQTVFNYNASDIAYVSKFEGTNDGTTITSPRYELGICKDVVDDAGHFNAEATCAKVTDLPVTPEEASVEASSKVFTMKGQTVLAIPYHSMPHIESTGDASVGQEGSSAQGVLLYDDSGNLLKNISLEGQNYNGYSITGAQDVSYDPETDTLILACSNYGSQARSDDTQVVSDRYGSRYIPSALVTIQDPLGEADIKVKPLVLEDGTAFYDVVQIEPDNGLLQATAILGSDGYNAAVLSIDPLADNWSESGALELVDNSILAGSGYVTSLDGGRLIITGEVGFDDDSTHATDFSTGKGEISPKVVSLVTDTGVREIDMPVGSTYVAGAVSVDGESFSGLFASAQVETIPGQSGEMSAYWYTGEEWKPLSENVTASFALSPFVMGVAEKPLIANPLAKTDVKNHVPESTVYFYQ